MNARDLARPIAPPSRRAQFSTLHVDLGADLKSAVAQAAAQAGVRPSDWVRSQLAKAVRSSEPSPESQRELGPRRRSAPAATEPTSAAKGHQLSLQTDDLAWLDQIAQAGGFRSRPAALRYALRVLASYEGLAALKQLPMAIPMLVESNITLQAAVRDRNHLHVEGYEPSRMESLDKASLRREIGEHLEKVSRLVAALQPLLANPNQGQERGVR